MINKLITFLENNNRNIENCRICDLSIDKQKQQYHRNFAVHHINGNKKDNRINNIIILCSFCHYSIHFPTIPKAIELIKIKASQRLLNKSWEEVFGKEKAERMKRNIAIRNKEINWNLGKPKSEEHKRKMSEAFEGKTYEEIYGKDVAKMKKEKHSKFMKEFWKTKERNKLGQFVSK
jgi:hypothetical protein